jgi:PAS domain S-box-containing protein
LPSHSTIMKKKISNPDPGLLRVLLLEDNPTDAELVKHELQRTGIIFQSRLVDIKKEFIKALAEFQPQVILADFSLPMFNGLAALETANQLAPDTPFIFVSGSIGEEKAIDLLNQGASDYIFKDNLHRLGPAVKRVVEAARLKLAKIKTDEELSRHIDQLRLLAETADRFVHINDLDEIYDYLAQKITAISGADYLLLSLYDEKLQAVRPKIVTGFEPFRETILRRFNIDPLQMIFYLKDMRPDDFSDFVSRRLLPVRDGLYGLANRNIPRSICRLIEKILAINSIHTMGFSWENQLYGGLTIVFKKGNELQNQDQVETMLNQATIAIKRLLAEKLLRENEEQLRQSEEYYRTLVETSPDAIIIVDAGGRVTFSSLKTLELFSIPAQTSITGFSIMDFVETEEILRVQERMVEILSGGSLPQINVYKLLKQNRHSFWAEVSSAPLKDTMGRNIGLLLVCRDISERMQIEAEILRQKAFLEKLVEAAPEGIAITDRPGRVLQVNSEFVRMFGYPAEEIVGEMINDLIAPPGYQEEAGNLTTTSGEGKKVALETVRKRKDGTILDVSIIGAPIFIAGQQVAVYAIYHDISERKRIEKQVQYQAGLMQNVSDAIIATDKIGAISMWNRAAEKIYGWEADEVTGKYFHDIIKPEYIMQSREEVFAALERKEVWSGEMIHKLKNGEMIPVISTITILKDATGGPAGTVSVNHDISDRKQNEKIILASLKEKEVLLQEIHHRVKNNLQIISGLLTLQADQSAGKSLDEVFSASQDRIRSIALIHEKLYRSRNLAEIAFDEYLRTLTENLFISQGIAAGRITVKYELESIMFTIEKAIPLGLIVNELLTNALKHAFPDGRQGEIRIGLHGYMEAKSYALKTDSGTLHIVPICELIVADNGIGLPDGRLPEMEKTLGMNLVSMLARQIQAELKVKAGPGTEFRLVFSGQPASANANDKHPQGDS